MPRERPADAVVERIIVGIHGVGTPAIGAVVQSIAQGFANAHPGAEVEEQASIVSIGSAFGPSVYQGLALTQSGKTIQVWEVNWSDLKGLPDGAVGSLFYALKALVATVQISDKGWDENSRGVTGPLFFGFILRAYFCAFCLVAPLNLLIIGYAYVHLGKPFIAGAVIVAFAAVVSVVIWLLMAIDRLIFFSLPVFWIGVGVALWIVCPSSGVERLLDVAIWATGYIEAGFFIIALCGLIELAIKFGMTKKTSATQSTTTVLVTRSAIMVVAVSLGAGAYGAIVNAIGFYGLNKLFDWGLASQDLFKTFGDRYLAEIGYHVAQMELINGATTFAIGLFLVAGIGYQLVRIAGAPGSASAPRGLSIRNVLAVFLWLTIAGFMFVFVCTLADIRGLFDLSDAGCPKGAVCSIYGIQWLLRSKHTEMLSPMNIYLSSATRIVPFLLPAIIPPLRAGLNAAADVLLYVLPGEFKLSLARCAKARLGRLLVHLRAQSPDADISLLAHSQGTVVARDVLGDGGLRVERLVTAGSPLASLYRRFLGRPIADIAGCPWTNIYRLSDYVGGPLETAGIEDRPLPSNYGDAHFFYFEAANVINSALCRSWAECRFRAQFPGCGA
jgi:hypothetical protein